MAKMYNCWEKGGSCEEVSKLDIFDKPFYYDPMVVLTS